MVRAAEMATAARMAGEGCVGESEGAVSSITGPSADPGAELTGGAGNMSGDSVGVAEVEGMLDDGGVAPAVGGNSGSGGLAGGEDSGEGVITSAGGDAAGEYAGEADGVAAAGVGLAGDAAVDDGVGDGETVFRGGDAGGEAEGLIFGEFAAGAGETTGDFVGDE
ncbi:uncharacterized protein LOC127254443 [Andrographis paniculata]|uniref:uncharacterized protein LOC127254443 n=1 Tax=Andrographis paniculata TaxID=175694 RepID=UPI0021E6EC9D|nr:uncharacterized protein LOC127254443 [Andrographis paniculata]